MVDFRHNQGNVAFAFVFLGSFWGLWITKSNNAPYGLLLLNLYNLSTGTLVCKTAPSFKSRKPAWTLCCMLWASNFLLLIFSFILRIAINYFFNLLIPVFLYSFNSLIKFKKCSLRLSPCL